MSWLARSFADSLRIDNGGDDEPDHHNHHHTPTSKPQTPSSSIENEEQYHCNEDQQYDHEDPSKGVKEDLSELKQTLTRQLWGVASFLAPPVTPSQSQTVRSVDSEWKRWEPSEQSVSGDGDEEDVSDSVGVSGIRSDISDFRDKAVSGMSRLASNFYSYGSSGGEEEEKENEKEIMAKEMEEEEKEMAKETDEEEEEEFEIGNAVGVTDEVLTFAGNIARHPETWLDFPIDEEDDTDDFDMSSTQQEHALAVERLAPWLAALRIELCPYHMSEGYFWKVYFVLLHSRLNKQDADLLSTPQVMAARALWMQELHKKTKQENDWSGRNRSYSKPGALEEGLVPPSYYDTHYEDMSPRTFSYEAASFSGTTDFETEKHPIVVTEMQIVDKSVIEEKTVIRTNDKYLVAGSSSKLLAQSYEDDEEEDADDWLKDENLDLGGYSGTAITLGTDEDVSFSDLEDEGDLVSPIKSKSLKGY